ncbi:hypothetical protein IV203_006075 [Nitzschia inconspicua]|uniref:Uncharacterized protein n=1 Tax=Nitzschia inconspicua TaxID=303405 RepID=A0A9K3PHJ0_9STRA|nr:hypothetical protein IV203_006075 [Nitzschia inconspicua]
MKILSPPLLQFCKASRDAAQNCRKQIDNSFSNQDCILLDKNVVKCESAVKQAFQHINLRGCPFQIKALTLCEDEWCHLQDPKSCTKECSAVREALSSCIQQQVSHYFERSDLTTNGTPAV